MNARNILSFNDSLGDGVQFTVKDEGLRVHCHCDNCGDSETGFGNEVGYDLNLKQVDKLIKFLMESYAC